MTIDHVRALDVVLSDGSPRPARAGRRGRAAAPGRGCRAREGGDLPRAARTSSARHAHGHRRRLPVVLAAGLRLPARPARRRRRRPFDLAKFVVGSEGTLAVATGRLVGLVPKPARTVIAVGHFTSVAAAIDATDGRAGLRPGRGRADGPDDPRPVPAEDRVRRRWARSWRATRTRCCSSRSPATTRPSWPAGSTGSTRCGSGTATATTRCARSPPPSRARCSRCASPAWGC